MSISLFKKGGLKAGEFKPSGLTMPSGAVFDLPLAASASTAVTGQSIETVGTVSYSSVQGIPSMTPQGESYLLTSDNGFPASGNPRSVSFWVYLKEAIQEIAIIFSYGTANESSRYSIGFGAGNILTVYGFANNAVFDYSFAAGQWYHVAVVFSSNQSKLYVNGNEASEWIAHPDTINTTLCDCCIGAISDEYTYWADECNIASVKLFDRVLSAEEIQTLSQEFIPAVTYETSSGFDAFGYPLKYDTASEAGCEKILPIPEYGLVFYAPLDKEASTAVTGQSWSISGTVNYKTVDGIPCAQFTGSQCMKSTQMTGFPAGNTPRTMSAWINAVDINTDVYTFSYGATDQKGYFGLDVNSGTVQIATSSNTSPVKCPIEANKWYHFAAAYDGELLHLYCNGELFGSDAFPDPTLNTVLNYVNIGAGYAGDVFNFNGYVAACRLYDRVLSATEIKALAKEFKI